jgi:hypothetical protein
MPEETKGEGREWVSAKDAAAMLELKSPWLIYRLRYAGRLKGYSLPGVDSLRFKRSDIEALMQPAEYVYTPRPRRPESAGV